MTGGDDLSLQIKRTTSSSSTDMLLLFVDWLRHGVTPFTPLKGLIIQGPIFISFFFAVRCLYVYTQVFYCFWLLLSMCSLMFVYRSGIWPRKSHHLKPGELFGLLIWPPQIPLISCHSSLQWLSWLW